MPTPNYDQWKTTPPESKVVYQCEQCDCDIHINEEMVVLEDGTILCEETECFNEYAKELLQPRTEYAGDY